MYRKPILTIEQVEALKGKLVRLEFGDVGMAGDWSGIVLGARGGHIMFRRKDGMDDDLAVIAGYWVVFVTTSEETIPEDEAPMAGVRWRMRHLLPQLP